LCVKKFLGTICRAIPLPPIIAAGRIQCSATAENVIQQGQADLVGLARVLFADPLWPKKAKGEINEPTVPCEPTCSLCMKRVGKGKPAFCSQWSKERRKDFLRRVGEMEGNVEGSFLQRRTWNVLFGENMK